MKKTRILVIDDEVLLVKSTCLVLNVSGFETEGALDGTEGIRKAQSTVPDLILLDVMMPGMDGWSVLEKLKADETTKHIPVIIFTAKEYSDGKSLAQSKGAADFVAKPFEVQELTALIKTYLCGSED